MDGQLVFFQGKRRLFHRYLKSFLVPGPLRYLPPLDAFATASSAFSVELYTYQGLGEATSGESKGARDAEAQGAAAPEQGQGQAGTRGKDVAPRWAWTAGEGIVAIKVGEGQAGGVAVSQGVGWAVLPKGQAGGVAVLAILQMALTHESLVALSYLRCPPSLPRSGHRRWLRPRTATTGAWRTRLCWGSVTCSC